jgi:hypothetical protein
MRPSLECIELSYLIHLKTLLEKAIPVLSRFIQEAHDTGIGEESDLRLQMPLPLPAPDEWHFPEPGTSRGSLHE